MKKSGFQKLWTLPIRTSKGRAPASELVSLRGSLPSEIALQGGSLESKIVYRGGRCRLRKIVNIFSAHNDRVTWNVEKRGFQKTIKKFWLRKFSVLSFSIRTSKGRAPASELELLRGGLPSEIALQGGSLESKIVYRGGRCRLRKTVNIFSAHNDRVTWNVEKRGFQKTIKKFWLRKFSVLSFSIRTSKGRAPASELELLSGGLTSEIALQGRTGYFTAPLGGALPPPPWTIYATPWKMCLWDLNNIIF